MDFLLGAQDPAKKHEKKIFAISEVLGIPPAEVLELALEADPTRHDYLNWILSQMKFENIRLPDDAGWVQGTLKNLEELKLIRPEGLSLDINSYRTIWDLENAIEPFLSEESERTRNSPRVIEELPKGVELYRESENYRILKISDPDACVYLSRGTSWCTQEHASALRYIESDDFLYLILKRQQNGDWKVHGQYTRLYTEVMNTRNQPFKSIADELLWLMQPEESDDPLQTIAERSLFASMVMKDRWHEIESEMLSSVKPQLLYLYAKHAIKGPWPEAEDRIASDPMAAHLYAYDVIGGRWPKGEAAIATSPDDAFDYARHILQDLWPEAEPAIASNPQTALKYASHFIKGPWPPGEKAIAREGRESFYYAKDIIMGPWPKGEAAIRDYPNFWRAYVKDVLKPAIEVEPSLAEHYPEAVDSM